MLQNALRSVPDGPKIIFKIRVDFINFLNNPIWTAILNVKQE